MKWLEVSVRVDGEAAEAVSEFLSQSYQPADGSSSVVVEADGYDARGELTSTAVAVKLYLPVDSQLEAAQRRIEEGLWHLGQLYPVAEPQFRLLTQDDWAHAWKAHYHPMRIGARLIIKPSWRTWEAAPDDLVVDLDPGMAFGTGLHPSTRMCLILLERYLRPDMRVLDQGSGSGILSLAAAKLGASLVHARDIDPVAVQATQENALLNGLGDRIAASQGALPPDGPYDLILCNILADIIISLLEQGLATRLAPNGILIASGILDTFADDVAAAMQAHGLTIRERLVEGDWVGFAAQAGE
jgi:ribosomal protein L11 methyltransferase